MFTVGRSGNHAELGYTPAFDREGVTALAFSILGSLAITSVLVLTYGNIAAAAALLAIMLIIMVTVYRLFWGFCIFIGLVLTLDQFDIPGFDPLTLKISYFENLKEIRYLPHFEAGVLNPLELHLLILLFVWVILLCAKKEVTLRRIPLWPALALLFTWIVSSFVYGLHRGGAFLPALWEIRALFYFALMYMLVPQIVRTKEDVRTLMWICIGAISFKALQGAARYFRIGMSLQGYPVLTNHEDPVFFVTLIVLLFGLVLFGGDAKQRRVLIWLLPLFLVAFFVAQRRAAYASAAISSFAFFVLLPKRERWMLVRSMLPYICVFVIYCVGMWNSDSKWAFPVRLVKSGFSNDVETAGERFYSNLYREREKYDLAVTIRNSPVVGIGFGNKYEFPIQLVPIPFPLRDYIPHNEIFWLLVKMGAIGFFLFWLFFDSFMFQGASTFFQLKDPYLKAVCAVIVIAVINQMVVSYYDLQLTYYRNMVYLGTLAGLLPVLQQLGLQPQKKVGIHE